MIRSIRNTEKILGNYEKEPHSSELKNIETIRKSIVAKKKIEIDEVISSEKIAIKRPARGRSPMDYWDILDKKSTINYEEDDFIK